MLDTAEVIENLSILYSQGKPCPKKTQKVLGNKQIPSKFLTHEEKAELIAQVVDHGFPINRIWVFPWYEDEVADFEGEPMIDIVCGLDESAKTEPIYVEGALRLDMFDATDKATVAIHCIWDNALNMTAPNGILPEWAADWEK